MSILGKLNEATTSDWDNLTKPFKPLCPPSITASVKDVQYPPSAMKTQVGGSHYKNSPHQPLEIVLDTEGYEAFRGACLVKVYKYLQRKKNNRLEDYRKAQHVLMMLIEEEENIEQVEREYEKANGIY